VVSEDEIESLDFYQALEGFEVVDTKTLDMGVGFLYLKHPDGAEMVKSSNWGYEVFYIKNE
jgi:hypothetical protein